jgi:hypothetical protein
MAMNDNDNNKVNINFVPLHDYIKNNGVKNNGRDVSINWYTDGGSFTRFNIKDYNSIMWEYNKNIILNKQDTEILLIEIERELKDCGINYAIKCITTVEDINDIDNPNKMKYKKECKVDENNLINVGNDKKIDINLPVKIYRSRELNNNKNGNDKNIVNDNKKEKNVCEELSKDKYVAKIKLENKIFASYAKDNSVYENKEKNISFGEIMGFRIHNNKRNISVCFDFWKDDEKIVLRLEDKKTGKVSKILFQSSLNEILGKIKEEENNCGYN